VADLVRRGRARSPKIGDEAQWCLFDPVVSDCYGRRFLRSSSSADHSQVFHFNRSLAQVTGDWRSAELYYLHNGRYMRNPHMRCMDTSQPAGGACNRCAHRLRSAKDDLKIGTEASRAPRTANSG
jgi:hypothetical protein